jgi:hypothetical protein
MNRLKNTKTFMMKAKKFLCAHDAETPDVIGGWRLVEIEKR